MSAMEHRVITPLPASHPEFGRWLWALEDTRARTKASVAGLDQAALDWTGSGVENSIGSLLYHMAHHIALIEGDCLYGDILGMVDYPAWLDEADAFVIPDRDDAGRMSVVSGVSLEEHLARLDRVRREFLRLVAPLTTEQLAMPHRNNTSPAWGLHHLMQHEAEHRGQIATIRALQRA